MLFKESFYMYLYKTRSQMNRTLRAAQKTPGCSPFPITNSYPHIPSGNNTALPFVITMSLLLCFPENKT